MYLEHAERFCLMIKTPLKFARENIMYITKTLSNVGCVQMVMQLDRCCCS